MIGKLSGIIDSLRHSQVLLDVNGVGYVVTCSARTLRVLGKNGDQATLRIETYVREDAINLYGFATADEQDWFNLLTTVQGVGAKVALAILSSLSPEQLGSIIAAQDKGALTQADGVGPKLALRLITELKDKVPSLAATPVSPSNNGALSDISDPSNIASDAVSALVNLGYKRVEAFGAIAAVHRSNPNSGLNDLIRLGLAELSRKDSAA